MKKILFLLFLIILINIVTAERTGISITPACYPFDSSGRCYYMNITKESYEIELHIKNFDDTTRRFTVSAEGPLAKRTITIPKSFLLEKHNRQSCENSPGCQIVIARINTSDLPPGDYITDILALSSATKEGAVAINQIVKSNILFRVSSNMTGTEKEKIFNLQSFIALIATFAVFLAFLFFIRKPKRKHVI